jgi:hypothetical protein
MIRRRVWIGFILMLCVAAWSAAAKLPPNFVIIFIDDMGYADIGPFGAKGYRTPNLARPVRCARARARCLTAAAGSRP